MPRLFVEFWRLRQHAVVDEAVREGSRRRRPEGGWPLPAGVGERLRGLLEANGFDCSRPITVEEAVDRDGFELSQ